jgi:hypothetical protein
VAVINVRVRSGKGFKNIRRLQSCAHGAAPITPSEPSKHTVHIFDPAEKVIIASRLLFPPEWHPSLTSACNARSFVSERAFFRTVIYA